MLLADGDKSLQIARLQPVVGVGKDDEIALGVLDTKIARGGQPAVGLVEHTDFLGARRLFVADGGAAVRGAVVHKDHLKVAAGLAQHGIYRFRQILPRVVHRQNHCNHVFHSSVCPRVINSIYFNNYTINIHALQVLFRYFVPICRKESLGTYSQRRVVRICF